jgi:ribonuclease R
LPFVTIDPEDARDHDDAVFAEFTSVHEPFVVWVAIADVARYVRAGGDLDREAWTKANSVYFPDRVEPMLPERLSADLCSLRQGEERAVLAVRMSFAADGRKTGHVFRRALIRSRAKLSYHQAQAGFDGRIDAAADPWRETVLEPLQAAYRGLARARERRGPLDIDSPERRIELNGDGEVVSVAKRERLEAHRLIEEMMIQANVCAAETLEQKKSAFIYRIHEAPSEIKLAALADFLETVGLSWSRGEPPRTDRFNRLLQTCAGGVHQDIVNEVVLRTQMQARYSPENFGHFGLNLSRYAHFTSPIRRYADLVVHRALIRALDLGADGLSDADAARLEATADHITAAERTAMAAERDAVDRYMAAFLQDRVGATFAGRITGVTRFGLFVRLEETGADGLVPIGSLGPEYLQHDERLHALVGERTGAAWRLGAAVEVRLKEAAPVTGGLLFEMLSDPQAAEPGAARRTSRSGSLKGQSKGPPRRLRRGR